MTDSTPTIEIREMTEESAYVAFVDEERAGRAEFVTREERRVFTHTEVDDAYSGGGVGSKLVRHALDDMRAREMRIVPLCPFFRAYIKRHPEYEDLVDREMLDRYLSKNR